MACLEPQRRIVRNKTHVTRTQLLAFLDLCWRKYLAAKIEPGTLSPDIFFVAETQEL